MSDRETLIAALDAFKRATANLAEVWIGGDFDGTEMGETYPGFLPDFAEVAFAVADMRVTAECEHDAAIGSTTCAACGAEVER